MGFSSAKAMIRAHAGITGYDVMLLDLTAVTSIDFTSSRAIEDMVVGTRDIGREVFLVGASDAVRAMLKKLRVLEHFSPDHQYRTREEALNHARELISGNNT